MHMKAASHVIPVHEIGNFGCPACSLEDAPEKKIDGLMGTDGVTVTLQDRRSIIESFTGGPWFQCRPITGLPMHMGSSCFSKIA
jgi:hypothetical protein